MTEPTKFAAGDTLQWKRSLAAYPASAGWTLHYALFNAAGAYTIDSTADGDDHAIDVPSTTTAGWTPGRYNWSAYVTHTDGRRQSLFSGGLLIEPDLTSDEAYDGRSHARKMLDAIEATIEGRATAKDMDLVRGQFGERAVERDPGKLITWRDKYRAEVENEEAAAALERGEKRPRHIKIRFSR